MLFQSQTFILLFLPVTLALYYATAGSRTLRQIVAVVASLTFYAAWDVRFVPLLVGLTLANWLFGRLHGLAFLGYVVVTVLVGARLRWPMWALLVALLAAVPPLLTWPVEIWFKRRGLLAPR